MNEALTQKLSAVLQRSLPKNYTSVSYAISYKGQILCADSLGYQDGSKLHPATTSCTYNVASVSKIYCTTAVMQLVEQGKVDLDTPIVEYLPDFKMLDERYRQITLRHCLSHTSGLPGTQWKHFSTADVSENHYYEEVYDYMAHSYLKAAPGEYSTYCNDGFTLAEMVVAQVSGQSYAEYCMEHITEPIGAHSSRLSPVRNTDYPLVKEGKKPGELLLIQGGAGYTTTMMDLCKFGQQFLGDSKILSQKSKEEMAKRQGATFLEEDIRSTAFGLGWDSVCYSDPDYDLGEGVLQKSGNSFQFTSKLYIVPKYNAVLTISETHDCKIDTITEIFRLFALYMLEARGINIYKQYQVIPQELIEKFDGTYLVPSRIYNTHFFGTDLTITSDSTYGEHVAVYKNLKFNGKDFVDQTGEHYFFRESPKGKFFFSTMRGKVIPSAQKAEDYPAVSAVWKERVGKQYLLINASEQDMACGEMMNGMTIKMLPGYEGVMIASFTSVPDGEIYGRFEGSFVPCDDNTGRGILQTPSNGSRDLVDPYFFTRDGVEYCWMLSYLYKEESAVAGYEGQSFGELAQGEYNDVFRLTSKLEKLPEVPAGRRLIVLNKGMEVVYDSQNPKEFKALEEGFIAFI